MPALSRERMVEALKNGGSVLLDTATGPKHVTRLQDLPAESELAAGDAERARAARQAVEGQMALLAREQQRLSDLERKAEEAQKAEAQKAKAQEAQEAEPQKAKAEEAPAAQQPQKAEPPAAPPAAPEKQAESGGEAERYEAARRGRGRG